MARKQTKRIELGGPAGGDTESQASGLTHNPFAALKSSVEGAGGEARATGPSAAPEGEDSSSAEVRSRNGQPGEGCLPRGASVVVRHERKGHGGKTVTVLDLSRIASQAYGPLKKEQLEALARDLRKALGVGARASSVETDQEVVVQGDLVDRVARHLEKVYGARVTLGTR